MLEVKTEKDLLDNFNHLKSIDRLEYIFNCKGCGKQTKNVNSVYNLRTRYNKIGFEKFLLCKSCATKLGKSQRTNEDRKKANEKRKITNLKKYGIENLFQDKEKIKKARLNKLGVENASQLQVVKDKKKENFFKRYGVENPTQLASVQNKRKQTCLVKYGVANPTTNETIQEKIRETNIRKFGVPYYSQSEEFKQHLRNIWKNEKKREALSKKVSKTWSQKSKEELRSIQSKRRKRFKFQNEYFDSSWELAVWIWAKDNNIQIKREPTCLSYIFNETIHNYYPDFEINGQLVEIKGDQFFDENNKMVCPWDSNKNNLYEAKHQIMISNDVQIWKSKELEPILNYIKEKYFDNFLSSFELKH